MFRGGRSWNNGLLVLRIVANDLDHNRYGFVTSKRLGNAVIRNRTRRRLREVIRVLPIATSWDIVISTKRAAAEADFPQLRTAVVQLLQRAGLLTRPAPVEGANR